MNPITRSLRERKGIKSFAAFVCCPGMNFGFLVALLLWALMFVASVAGSETQKHGGILRLAVPSDLLTLDPAILIVSPDQLFFTVHLRPGIKFSNGRDVGASVYICALEGILRPATGYTVLIGFGLKTDVL